MTLGCQGDGGECFVPGGEGFAGGEFGCFAAVAGGGSLSAFDFGGEECAEGFCGVPPPRGGGGQGVGGDGAGVWHSYLAQLVDDGVDCCCCWGVHDEVSPCEAGWWGVCGQGKAPQGCAHRGAGPGVSCVVLQHLPTGSA